MTNYNTATQKVKLYDEISLITLVAPNCWQIDDAFSGGTLHRLQCMIDNENNLFRPTKPNRRFIMSDGRDLEFLNRIGHQIIPGLAQITGIDLQLMDVKYWLDLPNFACQPHADSPDIIVSCQIYLDHPESPSPRLTSHGAEFNHVTPAYEIVYKPNRGYINLNTDNKIHQVQAGIGMRSSLMFQYNVCS
jgi:hypothetical protein